MQAVCLSVMRLVTYCTEGSDNMDGKNAKRSDDVTDEIWMHVNKINRDMVQDYLENQAESDNPRFVSQLRYF